MIELKQGAISPLLLAQLKDHGKTLGHTAVDNLRTSMGLPTHSYCQNVKKQIIEILDQSGLQKARVTEILESVANHYKNND